MKKAVVTIVCMFAAATVMAQDAGVGQGSKELRLGFNWDADSELGGQVSLDLGIGHYLTDSVVMGLLIGFDDNDLSTSYEFGVYGEYNFATDSEWVPYLGLSALWSASEIANAIDTDGAVGRGTVGMKYFVTPSWALFAEFAYSVASADIYAVQDGPAEDTNYGVDLGLRTYF